MAQHEALTRAAAFCDAFNLRVPILMAPMAGACPASLAIAVANAGGLGGCGALLMQPDAIGKWAADVRAGSNGGFQLNLWIPDPPPKRDAAVEDAVRRFLSNWGPEVASDVADVTPPDFEGQCEAMLEIGPAIISSIMGLYPDQFIARIKRARRLSGSRLRQRLARQKPPKVPAPTLLSLKGWTAPILCQTVAEIKV